MLTIYKLLIFSLKRFWGIRGKWGTVFGWGGQLKSNVEIF